MRERVLPFELQQLETRTKSAANSPLTSTSEQRNRAEISIPTTLSMSASDEMEQKDFG